jgi:hypothetical protein
MDISTLFPAQKSTAFKKEIILSYNSHNFNRTIHGERNDYVLYMFHARGGEGGGRCRLLMK